MSNLQRKDDNALIISVKVLPCPFCGSDAIAEPWHGGSPTKTMILCPNREGDNICWPSPSVTGEDVLEAIRRWNRRAV